MPSQRRGLRAESFRGALLAERESRPAMSDAEIILRLLNPGEARIVCQLLDSYGIPANLWSGSLPQTVYPNNIGEILISVPAEFREEALRIIATHRIEGGLMGEMPAEDGGEAAEGGGEAAEGGSEAGGDGEPDEPLRDGEN